MRIGSVLIGTGFGGRICSDDLHLLKPVPVSDGTCGAHSLHLHLVPLLQIIDLVLTLLHALIRLRLIATNAPISHRLRHLLPVPPAQIPAVQLVVLLGVRFQKTRDRRIRPFLSILPVIPAIRFVSRLRLA